MAKKAVDSTLRRILNYTAEILISIILLITISIPLAFTIPMWFQYVFFNVPRTELTINPAEWWGLDGAFWVTVFLGLVSIGIGYLYIMKMNPGVTGDDEEEEEYDEEEESEEAEIGDIEEKAEDIAAEDIPLEDQEEEEEPLLDENEESLEDESEEE
jgi:hypothetical protein